MVSQFFTLLSAYPDSMWRRRIIGFIILLGWALFAWLTTHRSQSPEYFSRYSPEYLVFLGLALIGMIGLSTLAYGRKKTRPRVRLGSAIGLVVGATLVSLIAVETIVRWADVLGVSFFQEVTRYALELERDEELVLKHRAGLSTTYQDVEFSTNELGLRDRPLPESSSEAMRILILGDSVTVGWGVSAQETFARRLEASLTAHLGRPVRTINAGVVGYNTEQEFIFLKRHVTSLAPDMVILVYVDNDVELQAEDINTLRTRWQDPPGLNGRLLRWSWFYRLAHFVTLIHVNPKLAGDTNVRDIPGWSRSMEALTKIDELTRRSDTPFVTFLYRMLPDSRTDAQHTDISDIAVRRGFPFVDMLSWFDGVNARSVTNSFIDSHPNSEGHRIIAEGMSRMLVDNGMLCPTGSGPEHPGCPR